MPKSKSNRRTQRQKGHRIGNKAYADAMQALRRSNATVPVPAGDVNKDPKHKGPRGRQWLDQD